MRYISVAAALVLALLLAACSSSPAPGTGSSSGARQIQVTMSDQLRFEPAQMQVRTGEAVEFVVRNTGKIRHEFFLGDEKAQQDHEMEMAQMGGMPADEPNGIVVEAGQTKTLRHTFSAAGGIIAGCHETGHYAGGMKANITVTS